MQHRRSQGGSVRALLKECLEIAERAPELNMCNYDHDQVAELNQAMIEITLKLRSALSAPAGLPEHTTLMKFYAVETLPDLIKAQARHIERLQAKLPPTRDTQPGRVREG